jgi:hypothetical protein
MGTRTGNSAARFVAIGAVAGAVLLGGTGSAGAAITLGQVAPDNPGPCNVVADRVQPEVSSSSYVVPNTGTTDTITSWSTNADAAGTMTMKIFRQVSGLEYSVVAHDGPRTLTPDSLNTFSATIPVKPGDVVGLNTGDGVGCIFDSPGDTYLGRVGDLADGQSGTFSAAFPVTPDNRLNIRAVLEPVNTFIVGTVTRNKKKGSARVAVTVPNPGVLTLFGGGSKVQQASGRAATKAVSAPGTFRLTVKAKGKKRKKLNSTGKVKVAPTISFLPTGGTPTSQTVRVKLKKKI